MPRQIWEKITPEFPRAPISAPCAMLCAIWPAFAESFFATSWQAACMVSDMFVPVSPSGTGKTLRELTVCWLVLSHVSPAKTSFLRSFPSMQGAGAMGTVSGERSVWGAVDVISGILPQG